MKSSKRKRTLAAKRQAKKTRFENSADSKHRSKYARKAAYLHKAGKWGWEIPNPKPW